MIDLMVLLNLTGKIKILLDLVNLTENVLRFTKSNLKVVFP